MKCSQCGAEISEGMMFCDACGSVIDHTRKVDKKRNNKVDNVSSSSRRVLPSNVIVIILLVCIAILMICTISYIISSSNKNNKSPRASREHDVYSVSAGDVDKEKQTSIPAYSSNTEVSTPNPSVMQEIVDTDSNGYAIYRNEVYHFHCKYPSWFIVIMSNDTLLQCKSPDRETTMYVGAFDNIISIENELEKEKNILHDSSYDDCIEYETSGSDYFAIRILKASTYYYTYGKLKNGILYKFELQFPSTQFDEYDYMINYIYNDFVKQF